MLTEINAKKVILPFNIAKQKWNTSKGLTHSKGTMTRQNNTKIVYGNNMYSLNGSRRDHTEKV